MRILVNGAERLLSDSTTVAGLLAMLEIRGRIAVEINGELVPRSAHAAHEIVDGDRVEIVQAIGGGDCAHRLSSTRPTLIRGEGSSGNAT